MKPKIELGKPYEITDYKGEKLAGLWIPLVKMPKGKYFVQTPQGGTTEIKKTQIIVK